MTENGKVSPIRLQVMWTRLIALVEEQAQTLLRTAFSPVVRESGDLSAGIFDRRGRMLAQAVTGTPGHINTMARSVGFFLDLFPLETMEEGDVYVTNDPWYGTGHLNDYVVVTPSFYESNIVALFACTGHMTDVGGIGFSPAGEDVFYEGVTIPPMKLISRGKVNETLLAIAKANSRMPLELEGDIYSQIASNETGSRRLTELLREVGQKDIVNLADYIVDASRTAMAKRLAGLPASSASYSMTVDGFEEAIELCCSVQIKDGAVNVDWAGSSKASAYGINVPLNYGTAYTSYALSCALAGDIPNNEGTLSAFTVRADKGSVLNATRPQPVACRHVIGAMLPDVVFGCLDQIIPDLVPAESASALWNLSIRGGENNRFATSIDTSGGTGARPGLDGLSVTSFPSTVRGTPVEIVESATPLIFWKRELREGSGGDGETRGGLGQDMELGSQGPDGFTIFAAFDRITYPARGRKGGEAGAKGELMLSTGEVLKGKGAHHVKAGQSIIIRTPGGGGYGDPSQRGSEARCVDTLRGYTSAKAATER
ncbi:hydantoinase B/oxoprolinase family protein [Mesorhizobium sp. M1E.F.Ca.ET.041.01.1.1]|uniref:hydantoinase B/oxoprolinase family protein n=1 Tax=Mesorhizobium sp. M1E.F.Ca.ET.041.01.1.1 TaxID=2496759 RepID=UPI000FCCA3F7|nr:hydantoinase B/oxoprolinase family protein [Mesorhizobium sp. M1E.F.Ca.ET.041.01.1.1]RUW36314.1 hydantoinase B/oxoprolinase family protein [Mesorhizobium sp. M1E.F.Ca.ET.041.01.1.1]